MKVLQVIDQAFRTTVEEQDDTILWLTQSMVGAGADLQVLLTGHGVQYVTQTQAQPALKLGDWQQRQPADLTQDIGRLVNKGIAVYALREDLEERGLADLPTQTGVEVIGRDALPGLYESVDQVWQW